MKSIKIAATLAALALTASVQANQDVSGFYIGGGAGSTNINADSDESGFKDVSKADGTTFKVITGYQFNRIVAIEAQYTKYGKVHLGGKDTDYTWKPTTFSVAANLGYTFQNGLRPFGTVGLSYLQLHENHKAFQDDSTTAVRLGAGLEYTPAALSDVSFRVGYEADLFAIDIKGSNNDVNVILGSAYLAATYKF